MVKPTGGVGRAALAAHRCRAQLQLAATAAAELRHPQHTAAQEGAKYHQPLPCALYGAAGAGVGGAGGARINALLRRAD